MDAHTTIARKRGIIVFGFVLTVTLFCLAVTFPNAAYALGWSTNSSGQTVYVDSTASDGSPVYHTGFLVTDTRGQGLQRYWFKADGALAVGELVDTGNGWWSFATSDGYVLRGKMDTGAGRVYLADNDGKLNSESGWLITGDYDGGDLQRYYMDANAHASRSGYFKVDGKSYFGFGGQGYVLRGPGTGVFGDTLLANNDGVLSTNGWAVTDVFGQGLQRYWFDENSAMSFDCLIDLGSGKYAYATDQGYVVRGASYAGGAMRYANNEGEISNGWVVTDVFGQGFQRYWQDGGRIATNSLIDVGNGVFAYATSSGPVVRGRYAVDNKVYMANNDGVLETPGWLVTDRYGQGFQRYWIDSAEHAAVVGFNSATYACYTLPEGYVLRGGIQTDYGMLYADNDGVVIEALYPEGWCVTDQFTGDLQRYYFKNVGGHLYATTGFFQAEMDGTKWFYGIPEEGFVARGKTPTVSGLLISDGNGSLAENASAEGWCVSNAYDGDLQRYYLENIGGHLYARTGFFYANINGREESFYSFDDQGFVVRNIDIVYDGAIYSSNNDGVLAYVGPAVSSASRDDSITDVTWSGDLGYLNVAKDQANQYGSRTGYFIAVDDALCRVVVMQRSGSSWSVIKTWNCNGGRQCYKWVGAHEIVHKKICNWADEYFDKGYNDWSSCFIESYTSNSQGHLRYVPGKGYEDCAAFHSTGYSWTGWDNTGCIGLTWDNAKWIYDNIPVGTNMSIFNPRM